MFNFGCVWFLCYCGAGFAFGNALGCETAGLHVGAALVFALTVYTVFLFGWKTERNRSRRTLVGRYELSREQPVGGGEDHRGGGGGAAGENGGGSAGPQRRHRRFERADQRIKNSGKNGRQPATPVVKAWKALSLLPPFIMHAKRRAAQTRLLEESYVYACPLRANRAMHANEKGASRTE